MALTQISTNGIKDATIATADIADDAVTADKIVDNAITAAALSNNCIAEANLQDDCITAAQIQAGVIAEANLNIDNTPTNDYVLTAKSSAAGGLTWAAAASGVGGATGVDFNDNVKIRFGSGNDSDIFHDGSNMYLTNTVGSIYIQGKAGENSLKATPDGAVDLYYDNELKLQTTATGLQVKDTSAVHTWVGLESSDGTCGYLVGQSNAGGGSDKAVAFYNAAGNETLLRGITDGTVELYYDNVKKFETTSSGATVIGELQIGDTSNHTKELRFADATRVDASSIKVDNSSNSDLLITNDRGSGSIRLATNSAERARINSDGQFLLGSTANYGTIGTAAAFQIQGTNTGGNVSMNIINAATSNASSTCDINAWQDYRLSTRIISGRENANNWTSASSQAASYLGFYTNSAGTVAERLRIDSSGRVGIGTTATDKNSHSLLNVHRSTSDSNYMYFTNSTTGEAGSDGFTIGLDGDENALVWNRENTNMRFGTNATERMTILAAGGLTFNGDTAAANALDDYEEGTFSPLLRTNGDTTGQATGSGTYVKIGRAVHIHVLFGNKTLTSLPTGDIAVVSLPFTANQTNGDEFGMSSKMVVMGVDSNSTHGYFRTGNGSAAALGYFNQDGSTWAQWSTTQWDNSGVYLIFNMTYFTNS